VLVTFSVLYFTTSEKLLYESIYNTIKYSSSNISSLLQTKLDGNKTLEDYQFDLLDEYKDLTVEERAAKSYLQFGTTSGLVTNPNFRKAIDTLIDAQIKNELVFIYTLYFTDSNHIVFIYDTDAANDPRNARDHEGNEYTPDNYMVHYPYITNIPSEDGINGYEYNPILFKFFSDAYTTNKYKSVEINDQYGRFFTGVVPNAAKKYLLCIDYSTESISQLQTSFIIIGSVLLIILATTFVGCGIYIYRLINKTELMQSRIETMAYYDNLTKLPNRSKLMEKLRDEASDNSLSEGLSALFIDLDNFKKVNDTEGHLIGDLVLQEVANFLQSCLDLRGMTFSGNTQDNFVARLGGDEFVILFNSKVKDEVIKFTDLLFREFIKLRKESRIFSTYEVSLSVGIAYYNANDGDYSSLLKHADFAMYKAKKAGKSQYHIYDPVTDIMGEEK
jgi:diguanylate cyclase (GGDEF)-like protein